MFMIMMWIARLSLGILSTDILHLRACTISGLISEIDGVLLSLYRSSEINGVEMLEIKTALEAQGRSFLIESGKFLPINPFTSKVIITWKSRERYPNSLVIQQFGFRLRAKVVLLFLSAIYLIWVASKIEEGVADPE